MNELYTHVSILLDRTGSMEEIRDDTIGGFNAFLEEQKQGAGMTTLTLVQFDSVDPYEILYKFTNIKNVARLNRKTYMPRSQTPLLDAIGYGINDLEKSIEMLEEKPERVIMAIVTDGQENASREFNKKRIKTMIKEKQQKDNWQFIFLSSDLDSLEDAREYGINDSTMMAFDRTTQQTKQAWIGVSSQVSKNRSGESMCDIFFTKEERNQQKNEGKRKK